VPLTDVVKLETLTVPLTWAEPDSDTVPDSNTEPARRTTKPLAVASGDAVVKLLPLTETVPETAVV
jgi:hypothetical protein